MVKLVITIILLKIVIMIVVIWERSFYISTELLHFYLLAQETLMALMFMTWFILLLYLSSFLIYYITISIIYHIISLHYENL